MPSNTFVIRNSSFVIILAVLLAGCATPPTLPPPTPTAQPLPTAPPFATRQPVLLAEGEDARTALRVTGTIVSVDIATHPIDNWPAIGAVQFPIPGRDARRAFVQVYNPHTGGWSLAQQLDSTTGSLGDDGESSLLIGITGDNGVHAVWGADDAAWQPGDSVSSEAWGLWLRSSTDYGTSWGEARRLAAGCWRALSMATTAEGWIVVLAACGRDRQTVEPVLIARQPDGEWRAPVTIATGAMPFLEGAVAISGDGTTAQVSVLLYSLVYSDVLVVGSAALTAERSLVLQSRSLGVADTSHMHRTIRALAFSRQEADSRVSQGIIFSWAALDTGGVYALTSLDAGKSWGEVEQIAPPSGAVVDAAVVYDPATDRFVALWPCCSDTTFTTTEATHTSAWSKPGSGVWSKPEVVVSGARVAGHTDLAQAANSRTGWLVWVERQQELRTRSINLNQLTGEQRTQNKEQRAKEHRTKNKEQSLVVTLNP